MHVETLPFQEWSLRPLKSESTFVTGFPHGVELSLCRCWKSWASQELQDAVELSSTVFKPSMNVPDWCHVMPHAGVTDAPMEIDEMPIDVRRRTMLVEKRASSHPSRLRRSLLVTSSSYGSTF